MKVRDVLARAKSSIAQRDAELLLCHVLGCERAWLLAHPDDQVGDSQEDRFVALVERRAKHEPLQYIVGVQEFYGLPLRVSPAVLIPRPETELLVEATLEWAKQQTAKLRIVDVGSGSGAIALALAANLPDAEILALDVSTEALAVAKENAEALGLGSRIQFMESDLLQAVERLGPFGAVVSNPPYVPAGDAATMQREVAGHEPALALFAGEDGLDIYRKLIPRAAECLLKGGLLAMEFGFGQQDALTELLRRWDDVRVIQDYAGIQRIVMATRI